MHIFNWIEFLLNSWVHNIFSCFLFLKNIHCAMNKSPVYRSFISSVGLLSYVSSITFFHLSHSYSCCLQHLYLYSHLKNWTVGEKRCSLCYFHDLYQTLLAQKANIPQDSSFIFCKLIRDQLKSNSAGRPPTFFSFFFLRKKLLIAPSFFPTAFIDIFIRSKCIFEHKHRDSWNVSWIV